MHFSAFFIAATALWATSATATCFQSGANWGDHGVAKTQLADACKELRGHYDPSESYGNCRNSPTENKSFKFSIDNRTGGGADISQDECYRNLGQQIDNCGHGGQATHGGLTYRYKLYNNVVVYKAAVADTDRADPNSGKCK